jgi:hypothetical protein
MSPTGRKVDYSNKSKKDRAPVGKISVEAVRMANIICTHDLDSDIFPCKDCQNECQATINSRRITDR